MSASASEASVAHFEQRCAEPDQWFFRLECFGSRKELQESGVFVELHVVRHAAYLDVQDVVPLSLWGWDAAFARREGGFDELVLRGDPSAVGGVPRGTSPRTPRSGPPGTLG